MPRSPRRHAAPSPPAIRRFSTRCSRGPTNAGKPNSAAADIGVRFEGLFLEADLATRARRAATRERDASDANADVARAQEAYDLGALAWHRVDASGTPDETLQRAKAALA